MKAGEGLDDNRACSADPGLLGLENPLEITPLKGRRWKFRQGSDSGLRGVGDGQGHSRNWAVSVGTDKERALLNRLNRLQSQKCHS